MNESIIKLKCSFQNLFKQMSIKKKHIFIFVQNEKENNFQTRYSKDLMDRVKYETLKIFHLDISSLQWTYVNNHKRV